MELENLNHDWQTIQNALNKLREQMEELNKKQNELWQKQNDLHIAGMNAGYKLDMKTKEWKKPENAENIFKCSCGNNQPTQFFCFDQKIENYYYDTKTCLLCGKITGQRRSHL